jgi:Flp pilus assembly protein TadG
MRHRRWDEGATAVETAIALTFLIPILLGIIEFGIAFYSVNSMQLMLDEAGRYAMINNTGSTSCSGALSTSVVTQANAILAIHPVLSSPSVSVSSCTAATTAPLGPPMMTIQGTFTPLNLLVPIPALTSQITVPLS